MERVTRDEWLMRCIEGLSLIFKKQAGVEVPSRLRVSCGWPSVGAMRRNRRRIGECWSPTASADKSFELFISPAIGDPVEVGAVLAHELVHAVDENKHGHGAPFKRIAVAVGLTGPMRATTASEDLKSRLGVLVKKLGPYPHAALDKLGLPSDYKKQTSRQLKAACSMCGYVIRVTRKWVEVGLPTCTQCGLPFLLEGEVA